MSGLGLLTQFGLSRATGGGCDQVGVTAASGWSTVNASFQGGWQFRVGDNDITCCGLRIYLDADATPVPHTLRLWPASGGALAIAEVTPVPGTWQEVEITPVVLTAALTYVVTQVATSGASRAVSRTPAAVAINPAITSEGGRYTTGTGYPSSSTANAYYSADILFKA